MCKTRGDVRGCDSQGGGYRRFSAQWVSSSIANPRLSSEHTAGCAGWCRASPICSWGNIYFEAQECILQPQRPMRLEGYVCGDAGLYGCADRDIYGIGSCSSGSVTTVERRGSVGMFRCGLRHCPTRGRWATPGDRWWVTRFAEHGEVVHKGLWL